MIYKRLSELSGETYAEIERKLGLGNGVIGKAIDRGSKVKDTTIAKIANSYPEFAKELDITAHERADEMFDETIKKLSGDIAQLYRQQSEDRGKISDLLNKVSTIEKRAQSLQTAMYALIQFSLGGFSKSLNKPFGELQSQLLAALNEHSGGTMDLPLVGNIQKQHKSDK